jgi:NAD(P)-dependent dehydrogenase (short-subunit alcohol dehydrogenase family)
VNMSSVQALATTGQVSPYAAAKGGILSLTRDMAREFGKNKIRVNAICPGCIHTSDGPNSCKHARRGIHREAHDAGHSAPAFR